MTKGRYAAHVIQWWAKQGCPAVLPADEAMLHLAKMKQSAPKK